MQNRRVSAFFALTLVFGLTVGAGPNTQSDITVTPARVKAGIAALDGMVRNIKSRSNVPGIAVAVVYNGKVVFAKGYGVRKIGTRERVDPNTVFQVASVSKSIASSVVAAAVSDGKVKWNEPIATALPWFTLSDPWVGSHVTIADMFAHRSGLPDHAGDDLESLGYSRGQILHKLALVPLDPFRVTYHYTNFGLTAGSEAAAVAEGTTWEALAQKKIFAPLGMMHSSYRRSDFARERDHATLHVRSGSTWEVSSRFPDAQAPAGGLSSSVLDLSKWMIMEMNMGTYAGRRIVGRDALLETWRPMMVSNPPQDPVGRSGFYGLGIGVNYDAAGMLHLSHSGAFSTGASTTYEMLPAAKLGIVVLTNGSPCGVPESIAKMFYDTVEFGKVQRDWYAAFSKVFAQVMAPSGELAGKKPPANPVAAMPLSSYVGTYASRYFGAATVSLHDGALTLALGIKPERYAMKHWNGNTFAFVPTGEESTGGPSAVTFAGSKDGHGMTMTVELLNSYGLGTFTRP